MKNVIDLINYIKNLRNFLAHLKSDRNYEENKTINVIYLAALSIKISFG